MVVVLSACWILMGLIVAAMICVKCSILSVTIVGDPWLKTPFHYFTTISKVIVVDSGLFHQFFGLVKFLKEFVFLLFVFLFLSLIEE